MGEANRRKDRPYADLMRDVIGNPFRPANLDRNWLRWKGGTVRTIAQSIYEDRAFDRLPILADALEDAGLPTAPSSITSAVPARVRGCFALDLLLRKL
jgi:hypothetical protein